MSPHHIGEKTWIEISAQALSRNISALRSLLDSEADFLAVVKSNAYGHDLDTIVRLCISEGVTSFGVDSIDEAMAVRKRTSDADIYILGMTVEARIKDIVENDLIQTVYTAEMISLIAEEAMKQQRVARVGIKIETGTMRQGVEIAKLEPLFIALRQNERFIELFAVSSHFSDAEDVANPEYTKKQQNLFCEALIKIHRAGFSPTKQHIACSAAGILYPETQFNLSRFGIAMYGLWSSESLRRRNRTSSRSIELAPALSWKTRIAQLKDVPAGATVGYSHGFFTNKAMRIAVLPIGYYDGLFRSYARAGEVLIRGQRCKIVGNICMNMSMVDVSHLPQCTKQDIVTILGKDGMHQITAEEIAEKTGTINYEVVTSIKQHLPRILT